MSEKTKKMLVIAGLVAVSIGVLFGISKVIYHEPVHEQGEELEESDEIEIVVEVEDSGTTDFEAESYEAESYEEEDSLVIELEPAEVKSETPQEIQKTPEKTDADKPSEPPVIAENADVNNPDTPPVYEDEEKESTEEDSTAPVNGDTKDGMMYVEGFGWIVDEGQGSGTYAGDMYENGNKIGIMD